MLKYLQRFLGRVGEIEYKHYYLVVLIILLFTGVALVGFTKLEYESDFSKFDPEDIEIVALEKELGKEFPSFKAFLVIVMLDDEFDTDIHDIRDPKVMEFLIELEKVLKNEQKIQSVGSAAAFFQGDRNNIPEDLDSVKVFLSQIPGSNSLFNDRYSMTPLYISVDVSGDSEDINNINRRVTELVQSSSKPGGVKAVVTGEPPLLAAIFDLMISDGIFTLIIATIVIFFMLFFLQRSVKDSFVIILPVLFGVIWTIGGLGWFNIKITVATAAIGAMLLGLGVEYSIFLNSRYNEEFSRAGSKKNSIKNSLIISLSTTGASTFSSGFTTIIGFSALTLSAFPMLADMGFSLAMGIALILGSVMFVGPIFIITRDRFLKKKISRKKEIKEPKIFNYFGIYGKFVSHRPWTVVIIAIVLTGVMFYGNNFIKNEEIDFDTILPENLPELDAFKLMNNEFEDTITTFLYIKLDPTLSDSNEPHDIRDPRIIKYADRLSQKALELEYVQEVRSIPFREKEISEIIPGSLAEQKEIIEKIRHDDLITKDNSGMLVRIIYTEVAWNNRNDVVPEIYDMVESTEEPIGTKIHVLGGMPLNYEMDRLIGPDSSKTGMIAFIIIIVFLILLTRSFKYTILPLVTVVVAILWIMGMIGYFQIGWNSIISSVISMTIGIGIDFGIQLSNRYRQESETYEKKEAMTRTLKYTLYPMIITVVAALIGFQAMTFGQLKLMGDLGRTMSISMVASMIVAVSLVAGLMIIFERKKSQQSLKTNNNKEKQGVLSLRFNSENTKNARKK